MERREKERERESSELSLRFEGAFRRVELRKSAESSDDIRGALFGDVTYVFTKESARGLLKPDVEGI